MGRCCSYVKTGLARSVLQTTRASCRLRQRIASRRLLPFRLLALEIGASGRVDARLRDRDSVEGGVELPVATAVEPVALDAAGARFERGDAAVPSELRVALEALDRSDLGEQLRRGHDAAAG
jgi:hypothetical protein